jgi:predicted nuclease of predicted toxin-antitoxin system
LIASPRIGLDQGCPRSSATALQRYDWDVVHVGDIGMSRATDAEIIQWATQEGRIVVTLDSDFHALLALGGLSRPSVIRVRQERLRGEMLATLLLSVWPRVTDALIGGAAITITERDVRIRKLPIAAYKAS